jgi:DNA-binding transcriptional LysR family regulator
VRESTAHVYASQAWIARHGRPATMADIAPGDLLGYDDTDRFAEHLVKAGLPVTADSFRLVSENTVVIWEMVRRGLGIGVMSREIAARTDDIVDLLPGTTLATFPVWLVTHGELRTNRRVRLVFDILAEELARLDPRA